MTDPNYQAALPLADIPAGQHSISTGRKSPPGSLYSPTIDFMLLGGGSVIVLIFVALFLPQESSLPAVAATMAALAYVINWPHFAHSYQIFYDNFGSKISGSYNSKSLRLRYLFAGIVVPAALLLFMSWALLYGEPRALGYAANMMFFLVGWHYVKQGYGMLIVNSVLKKSFFTDLEKRILVYNAYAVWCFSYTYLNSEVAKMAHWGIHYYTFDIPDFVTQAFGFVAVVGLITTLYMFARKGLAWGRSTPINGMIAYLTSLYLWIVFARFNILFSFMIPAFHSLQYLAIVWRYEGSVSAAKLREAASTSSMEAQPSLSSQVRKRLTYFILLGGALGYLGFRGIPLMLESFVGYDREIFGATAFLFVSTIFINVHHYFMDNVMWRRENRDVSKHLFSTD